MQYSIAKPVENQKKAVNLDRNATLILYNDDVNTFDHVIDCLVKICGLDIIQSEQLALQVHFKGKAAVKHGEREVLEGMCKQLCNQYLSATVGSN